MIKFAIFNTYALGSNSIYARAAVVVDKITSLVETGREGEAFTYIYLTEATGDENDCNYFKVKGTLEQTMLTIMAADAEHEQLPAVEKWAPINYREEG